MKPRRPKIKNQRPKSEQSQTKVSQQPLHLRTYIRGRFYDSNSCLFQCFHLFSRSAFTAGDDCSCVPHPSTGRRGLTRDKSDHWFCDIIFSERSSIFFGTPANFADHHNTISLIVSLKQSQCVDMSGSYDRIT